MPLQVISQSTDRMSPVSILNRIALVACERIMLLMNNTQMLKHEHRRIGSMNEVLVYLSGMHDDIGLSGDRGDFYRRKLAVEMVSAFNVHGIDHNNVHEVVAGAIDLERQTRLVMSGSVAQPIAYDNTVLDILARIAAIH